MSNDRPPYVAANGARPVQGVVYFAQCRDAVKIGYTAGSPEARIAALQTGCPWPIWLLGSVPSPPTGEVLLHNAFASHRLRGEWFDARAVSGALGAMAGVKRPLLAWTIAWNEPGHLDIRPTTEEAKATRHGDGDWTLTALVLARTKCGAGTRAALCFDGLSVQARLSVPDRVFFDDNPVDMWSRLDDVVDEALEERW